MFDIGFSELMVIAVVALVVVGPERLPRVARTMGHLFGRLQRYVNEVKADINREMELEELRKFKTEFEQAAHSVESEIKNEMNQAETTLTGMAQEASLQPEMQKVEAEIATIAKEASVDPHAVSASSESGESTAQGSDKPEKTGEAKPGTGLQEATAAGGAVHDS